MRTLILLSSFILTSALFSAQTVTQFQNSNPGIIMPTPNFQLNNEICFQLENTKEYESKLALYKALALKEGIVFHPRNNYAVFSPNITDLTSEKEVDLYLSTLKNRCLVERRMTSLN